MLLSELFYIFDFDSNEKFIVHFDDLDITESTVYGNLSKFCDNIVVSFSVNSDNIFVLVLRCS